MIEHDARSMEPDATASLVATHSHGLMRFALVAYDRPRMEREVERLQTSLGL